MIDAQYFASETPNVAYVRAEMTIPCEDSTELSRSEARASIRGECGWNVATNEISQFRPFEIAVQYREPEGGEEAKKHSYMYAEGMVFGHRSVTRTLREPV